VTAFESRYESIRERIDGAASRSGRKSSGIALMAVTKTRQVMELEEAWEAGIRLFGENRVQEAAEKIVAWPPVKVADWRLIGHLQRNKARKAVALFSRIESLDRRELALELQRILEEKEERMDTLIEVNTSGEASKHGVSPEGLELLLEQVLQACPRLEVKGLMTIGPLGANLSGTAKAFALLRELRDRNASRLGLVLPELSMGMSDDFEVAIEQGSTCVRLGRALFGPREYREG